MNKKLIFIFLIFGIIIKSQIIPPPPNSALPYGVATTELDNLDGISIFKIGKFTPQELEVLANSKKFKNLKCTAEECYEINDLKKSLIQHLPKKSLHTSPAKLFVDGFSYYKLNGYAINDKYQTESIEFEFFNDKLIGISISEPNFELTDNLKLKYGEGDLDKLEYKSKCTFNSKTYDYPVVSYRTEWANKVKDIYAYYNLSSERNQNCDKITRKTISIYEKTISKKLNSDGDILQQNWYKNSQIEEKEIEKKEKKSDLDEL